MLSDLSSISVQNVSKRVRAVREGIQHLKQMDVVLKQSDKNLGVVAIRRGIYNRLLFKNLGPQSFKMVPRFPQAVIQRKLRSILTGVTGVSDWQQEKLTKGIDETTEACPFYVIPKLHKAELGSRPITAQHSYILAPVSKELAGILQTEVNRIPCIARDSKAVVQQLEELKVNKPFVFLTYDVEQLYPSIDLNDAVKTLYDNLAVMRLKGGLYTRLLRLVMFNNYVTANGKTYLQTKGTATGTQVAPPFANLYLFFKFREILSRPDILFQSRYIDDGAILIETEEGARETVQRLNSHTNLNLTWQISPHSAIYLDLEIYKGTRFNTKGQLDFRVYFKPTNKLLYLPASSFHPRAHKLCIVRGEAIRCLRNCSNKAEWLQAMTHIFKGLMARGYKPQEIKKIWKTIKFEDRINYIFNMSIKTKIERSLVLTKYHPQIQHIWNAMIRKYPLRRYFLISKLGSYNKKQKNILEDWPPMIVFKDFNKLQTHLIKAKQDTSFATAVEPNQGTTSHRRHEMASQDNAHVDQD